MQKKTVDLIFVTDSERTNSKAAFQSYAGATVRHLLEWHSEYLSGGTVRFDSHARARQSARPIRVRLGPKVAQTLQ